MKADTPGNYGPMSGETGFVGWGVGVDNLAGMTVARFKDLCIDVTCPVR